MATPKTNDLANETDSQNPINKISIKQPSQDTLDEIEKLSHLKYKGILSSKEFEERKSKLLKK